MATLNLIFVTPEENWDYSLHVLYSQGIEKKVRGPAPGRHGTDTTERHLSFLLKLQSPYVEYCWSTPRELREPCGFERLWALSRKNQSSGLAFLTQEGRSPRKASRSRLGT